MALRVCERFGRDPGFLAGLDPEALDGLIAFETLRQREEARRDEMMAKAIAAAGNGR